MTVGGKIVQGGRRRHPQRHPGPASTRAAADDRRHGEPALPGVHEAGRQVPRRWACAPTPTRRDDAKVAREFGAEGIGLFRTEHMFYGEGSDEPLFQLRKMILSQHATRSATRPSTSCSPSSRSDIKATLEAMDGLPVTIRLLDPPLHEFVPQHAERPGRAGQGPGHRRRGRSRRAARPCTRSTR